MSDVPPPDPTEELLRGADRPRPLPPDLHRRLADRLTAAGGATAPAPPGTRPLPSGLRARLEHALPSEAAAEADTGDGADAPEEVRPRASWRWVNPLSAVAAAVVLVAAVVGLSLHGGGSGNQHVAASGNTDRSARTAAPPQLSASQGRAGSTASGAGPGSAASSAAPGNSQLPAAGGAGGATGAGAASPSEGTAAPAAPSVSGVSPGSGPTAGGTWVTVTGQNLGPATQVRFGTTPARQLVVVSGTELRALSPAHPLGVVDVTVVTPGGTSPVGPADRYTFLP